MKTKIIHDEKVDHKKISLISFISFLLGFAQATIAYILSSYFLKISGQDYVGMFFLISYIFVLIVLLNLHKVVKKIGKSQLFFFSSLGKNIILFTLAILEPSWFSSLFMIFYIILSAIEWVCIDIILESFSQDQLSGRIRGLHLTIFNAGFLLGPFLATKILDTYDFAGIFTFMLIFNAMVLSLSLIGLRNVNHRFNQDLKTLDVIKKAVRNKNIFRIYIISFVLEFFFALMTIYTPLYLKSLGFSWTDEGIILTIMLIPFVILQYPVGILADKRLGEKELLIFSILTMGASTLSIFFIASSNLAIWATVLFVTRIGACLIEVLRDSYFYKQIDGHDVDLINFFRTSIPVAYILATAISSLMLLFSPLKGIFILLFIVIMAAVYPAIKLKDTKCERELKNCR